MTSLVYHYATPQPDTEVVELGEDFKNDVEFAQRRSTTPVFGRFKRSRLQWFFILEDPGAVTPRELDRNGYDDIKRSEICLPVTSEMLQKLKRSLRKACNNNCVLIDIRRVECIESDVIFYAIRTRIKRRKE